MHKGDHITVWATGEGRDDKRPDRPFGPDGIGMSGRSVGRVGLVGRIGNGRRFDIGSRTHLLRVQGHRTVRHETPGPIKMNADGPLLLGAKDWKPHTYTGTFVVSIWRNP